jgi:hypothetical protein
MSIIKYFLIIVSITMLFALTSNESKASCPPGMSPYTFTMQIHGCDFEIEICYACGMTSPPELSLMSITMLDPNCTIYLSPEQIILYVENHIQTYSFIYSHVCQPYAYPGPCPPPIPIPDEEIVTFNHWVCWYIERFVYFGQERIRYLPCDYENRCVQKFTFCMDNGVYTRIPIGPPLMVGSVNCHLEAWQVEVPKEIGTSNCYRYTTPCGP